MVCKSDKNRLVWPDLGKKLKSGSEVLLLTQIPCSLETLTTQTMAMDQLHWF
jgi:hypothetical protein